MQSIDKYLQLLAEQPSLSEGRDNLVLDRQELENFLIRNPEVQLGVLGANSYLTFITDLLRVDDRDGKVIYVPYMRLISNSQLAGVCGSVVVAQIANEELSGFGRFVVVNHYRHATGKVHIEFPRGFGTPGVSGRDNALKELREETGLIGHEAYPLGSVLTDTGTGNARAEFFFVPVVAQGEAKPEAAERIESWETFSEAELLQRVAEGRIDDGYTLKGLTLLNASRLALSGKLLNV